MGCNVFFDVSRKFFSGLLSLKKKDCTGTRNKNARKINFINPSSEVINLER